MRSRFHQLLPTSPSWPDSRGGIAGLAWTMVAALGRSGPDGTATARLSDDARPVRVLAKSDVCQRVGAVARMGGVLRERRRVDRSCLLRSAGCGRAVRGACVYRAVRRGVSRGTPECSRWLGTRRRRDPQPASCESASGCGDGFRSHTSDAHGGRLFPAVSDRRVLPAQIPGAP